MRDADHSAAERTVGHLITLARSQLTEEAPKRGAADLLEVERALDRHRRAWRRRIWIARGATLGALLGIASVLAVLLPATRPSALMVEVLNGAVSASGHVDGSSRGTTLRFSDGTRFALAEQARAHVAAITAHGAELELERGKVSVHVVPLPESRWTLRAGGHRVQVTGTAFELEFEPEDQSLSLDLEKGSVSVSGPFIDGELRLKAGQHLEVRPTHGGVQVSARNEHTSAAASGAGDSASESILSPPALETSPREPSEASMEQKSPRQASIDSWRRRVAAGDFGEVMQQAERRGLARVYERGSLDELEALADAARYLRRNEVALATLKALRSRFKSSRAGRDATFFLGRIEEDRNAQASALEYYARYLEENPNGAYASHALGRKLVIIVGRDGTERALPIAREYSRRFPNGSHSEIAREIVQKASGGH